MERKYLDKSFMVSDWESLEPFFKELLGRNIETQEELLAWFRDRSELESVLSEDGAWRYIKMTCDTTDEALRDSFNFFIQEIQPMIAPYGDKLNKTKSARFLTECTATPLSSSSSDMNFKVGV